MQRNPRAASLLDWDDVRLFLAMFRARTVGEAAVSLAVDASTVSRRLTALEELLAATLFERGRGGITPTKAAEDLMPVAEEMEDVVTRFQHAAEGLERQVSGVVRITCPSDVADVIVVPSLRDLLARHPALRIAVDAGEAVLDLARREADLALRVVRPVRGDLVITRLTTVRWVLAATPEYARSLGTLRRWADAEWITWGERLGEVGPARWLSAHAGRVEPVVRSDSLAVQISAVRSGLGVALVPEPSVPHYGLVSVKLAPALRREAAGWPSNDLFLVAHRALRDVPRVRAVWEHLVGRFASATRTSGGQ